jgi:broad specificity phosphatase PhoE
MNDGSATSGVETLDKTHNNQSLNPNVVVVTHNIMLGSWKDHWMCPYWART